MKTGWKNNKRIKLAVICVMIVVLCAGYILYKPKLINADKPFIELAGSVGTAVGNAKDAVNRLTPVPTKEPNLTPAPTPVPKPATPTPPTPTPVPDNKVTIRVEDTSIYVNKLLCSDIDDLNRRLGSLVKDDSVVTLVDDYAELKTYRGVLMLLKQLGIDDYTVTRID